MTGATQGIGRAIAARLGASGAAWVLVDRNAEVLSETAEVLGAAAKVSIDIAAPGGADCMVQVARGCDILISNAGIAGSAPVGDLEPDRREEMLQVNSSGTGPLAAIFSKMRCQTWRRDQL